MPEAIHLASGKVREIYALDDDRLQLVASDRISTFDVILPTPIPDKGRVLTGMSAFWFARTRELVPNMLANGRGRVIAVSASGASRGQAAMGAYAASKSALQRLVEALSAEVAAQGISVNSIAPTIMDTPANRRAMPEADRSTWVPTAMAARVIGFLASEEGGWIHGQHLVVGR